MCMFDSCMCLGVCASLVVWSLTLLLDDTVSDSLLALVLAWGTGSSPGVKVSDIQQYRLRRLSKKKVVYGPDTAPTVRCED